MYEYTTRKLPYPQGAMLTSDDAFSSETGYKRIYADTTMEGVFAVYRRERIAAAPAPKPTKSEIHAIVPTPIKNIG